MRAFSVALTIVLGACAFDAPGATPGDDEPPIGPSVGFASASTSADETSTNLQIAVALSMAHDAPVTVEYALAGGTAMAAADFMLVGGALTFSPGETQQSIALAILPDTLEEAAETIEIALANPTGATLGSASHTVTIAEDILPRVAFSTPAVDVMEGATGDLELVLDKAAPVDVTVQVAVSGGNAGSGDYTFQDNVTVTFPAGSVSQIVPLVAIEDTLDELDEVVALQLVNPSAGVLTGVNFVQDVTLVDDDAAPTVSFLVATSSSGESQGSYFMIVRLSAASGRTVAVPFTVTAGTNAATPTTDYAIEASPLVFDPGEREHTITVTPVRDTMPEEDETVDVDLAEPSDGSATLGTITHRTHRILDDDTITVQWANSTGSAVESDTNNTYNITITLSRPANQTITVDFEVDQNQSTASPSDYSLSAQSVTFSAGEASRQFQFTVVGDNSNETNETLILQLVNPTGGATLGTPDRRSITIIDDDGGP